MGEMQTAASLSDGYLPDHHFAERHSITIRSNAAAIQDAIAHLDPADDALIGRLIRFRELPSRVFGRTVSEAPFGIDTFTLLARTENEVAYGLVGRFWTADFGLEAIPDGAAFQAFHRAGTAKLVMNFETEALADGRTQLTTRTRIYCPDRASRLKMIPYWMLIRPVSGLIRRRTLGLVKAKVEVSS